MALAFSSERFSQYIDKNDLELASIAEDLGVRADLLLAFCDGLAAPTPEFLSHMCDELGVDIF
jgi:hypothetical protein